MGLFLTRIRMAGERGPTVAAGQGPGKGIRQGPDRGDRTTVAAGQGGVGVKGHG